MEHELADVREARDREVRAGVRRTEVPVEVDEMQALQVRQVPRKVVDEPKPLRRVRT